MKKAVILARVSTPEQEKQGLSIEKIQLPQLREYAERNDLEVVKEFIFQETASNKLRKNFDEMIEFMKMNEDIKAILGYRIDRITRNYRDAVKMDDLCEEFDKEMHFVEDKLVLNKKSVGNELVQWDMKVFLAKQLINRCREDTRNTIISKLEAGEIYGKAPYGYKNTKDENGKASVGIKEFEAGIVKEIFNLYTNGANSYLTIARNITEKYGEKMYRGKIEHILTNKFYYGVREYEGREYPHIYERIIEKEIYEMAEDIRKGRTKSKKKGKMLGKHGTYRGLIKCSECGCFFTPNQNRHARIGRDVESECYYYCTNSKGIHKTKPKGTNDVELDKMFSGLMAKIQVPEEELGWLTEALNSSHEGKVAFTKEELKKCEEGIAEYQNMIESAYEDKCAGKITVEEYEGYRAKWRKKQKELEERLGKVLEADEEYYVTSAMLLDLAHRAQELFLGSKPEEKRVLIQTSLQNLCMKDGLLCYEWKKPFDSIAKSKECNSWGD